VRFGMKYMTLLAVLLCGYSHVIAWAQSPADWDWVNKHFPAVLNQLLPIEASSGTSVGFRLTGTSTLTSPSTPSSSIGIPKQTKLRS
jgi:hypothetical protein